MNDKIILEILKHAELESNLSECTLKLYLQPNELLTILKWLEKGKK